MGGKRDIYKPWRVALDGMRLTCQHLVWREHLGYNLNPLIQLGKSKPIRIADVATGTCLWSLQVAQDLGSACQIEASDMVLNLCPPDSLLPSNVRTRRWSFFEPVPADWIGKFDLVHVRLIVAIFPNKADPTPVLKRLISMLKPGGYIQWDEYSYDTSSGRSVGLIANEQKFPDPLKSHPSSVKFQQSIIDASNMDAEYFTKLVDKFRSAGLEDVSEDLTPRPNPSSIRAFYETWLGWATQMAELFSKLHPEKGRELGQLIEQMQRDQQEDGVIFYPKTRVVVGRRRKDSKI